MGLSSKSRNLYCSLVIALGGLVYGVDTGIVATTIAHPSFKRYMYGPSLKSTSLTGAIVSTYYAGNCIGSAASGLLIDRYSRKWTVFAATLWTIIGSAIQTGAVNVGMMIAGRFIAGVATGILLSVVPLYIAELAPAERRAYLVGMKGLLTAVGYLIANWIGYAGSFATGDLQWRIPLATQIPPAALLLVLSAYLPYSPRWLVSRERYEEAEQVIRSLHGDNNEEGVSRELYEIKEQLAFEKAQRTHASWIELFQLRYARRLLLAVFILQMIKLSGAGVVQNYQSLFYAGLGYKGRSVLLLSGCYGFMGLIGQMINLLWISDKWPRKMTMYVGSLALAGFLILLTIMSRFFGDGSNKAGAGAGVAFIFLYSMVFAIFFNSTVWVLVAEMFPQHLRGNGSAFAVFAMSVTNIWLSQVTPLAFEALEWKFYFVFIALNLLAAFIYFAFLPETNQKTLEEIAEVFGDAIVDKEKHVSEIERVQSNNNATVKDDTIEADRKTG